LTVALEFHHRRNTAADMAAGINLACAVAVVRLLRLR